MMPISPSHCHASYMFDKVRRLLRSRQDSSFRFFSLSFILSLFSVQIRVSFVLDEGSLRPAPLESLSHAMHKYAGRASTLLPGSPGR